MYILCTVEMDKNDKVFAINTEKPIAKFKVLERKRFFYGEGDERPIFVFRGEQAIDRIIIFGSSWIDGLYHIPKSDQYRVKGEFPNIHADWFEVGDTLRVKFWSDQEKFFKINYWLSPKNY